MALENLYVPGVCVTRLLIPGHGEHRVYNTLDTAQPGISLSPGLW